jgi:hypothetical protein
LNPVLYGVIALACMLVAVRMVQRHSWRNSLSVLLLIYALLSVRQIFVSASEVGQCFVEDKRWESYYYYCRTNASGYQEIETLPIGMQGWCSLCIWRW